MATPLTGTRLTVPDSVAEPGLSSSATERSLLVLTRLPSLSWTATCTGGVIGLFTPTVVGCVWKISLLACPATTSKALLVTSARPPP